MRLYSYFRSSASFRVRIALALKGLAFDYEAVHLRKNAQLATEFTALAPTQLVPQLIDGEHTIGQSLAIIEYLDETHPEPPLLPKTPAARARVRELALDIACEIHPLDNLRVLRYLVRELKLSEDAKNTWYRHWVEQGLAAVEAKLAASSDTGAFCHGDAPTMADCVLVPQIFNARNFECRLDQVPTVMRVFEHCMKHPAFQAAQPSACPDFEP